MPYSLGLDLGTTSSAVAINTDGNVRMFSRSHQDLVVPSVIHLDNDGNFTVGDAAERRALEDPAGVAREFKRRFGDPQPLILNGSPVAANDLMARLATHLVAQATDDMGAPPQQIVVSHPANWGDYKVSLLGDTLTHSSLPSHRLITEPEAAAIHDAQQEEVAPGTVIAVYDLGGGTFDVALLRKLDAGWDIVGRPSGIERLGGVDFDTAVLHHVVTALDIDLTSFDAADLPARQAMMRLREECRTAKHALSVDTSTSIPVLLPGFSESVRITRAEFERLISPAIARTLEVFDVMVDASPIGVGEIDRVLLVGGSSLIPFVSQKVANHTMRPLATDRHPKHAIALGAAASLAGPTTHRAEPLLVVDEPELSTPPVPPADAQAPKSPERVTLADMYELPHISEGPLPEFLTKRVEPPMPAAAKAATPPPRLVPDAAPTPASAASSTPPPVAASQNPTRVLPAPAAQRAPSSSTVAPTQEQRVRRQRGAGWFWAAVLLVAALAGGLTFYAIQLTGDDGETEATEDDDTGDNNTGSASGGLIGDDSDAGDGPTVPSAATPTTNEAGLDFETSCAADQLPDPGITYRVSEVPDNDEEQGLNGRNVPSISSVDGVASVPQTVFPEFGELDLTYMHCEVDSRGRAWWGVNFEGGVVWASTRFIEPAP